MSILKNWIKELGYDESTLVDNSYLCEEESSFLIPIESLDLGFDFPRKIDKVTYTEGMEVCRAKDILDGIFENKYLPAIEIDINYKLHNGYHRYAVSRYLNFSHIPVKII